jgi:hypothetical protein
MFKYYINVYKFCLKSNNTSLEWGSSDSKVDKTKELANDVKISIKDLEVSSSDALDIQEKTKEIKKLALEVSWEAKNKISSLQKDMQDTLISELKTNGIKITSMSSLQSIIDLAWIKSDRKMIDKINDNKWFFETITLKLTQNWELEIVNKKWFIDKASESAWNALETVKILWSDLNTWAKEMLNALYTWAKEMPNAVLSKLESWELPRLDNLSNVKKHIDWLKINLPEWYTFNIWEWKYIWKIVLNWPHNNISYFTPSKKENINMLTERWLQNFVDKYHNKWWDIQKNK